MSLEKLLNFTHGGSMAVQEANGCCIDGTAGSM